MHYLPLLMHSNNAADSIKSPFFYSFDGKRLAVCFFVDKDFAYEQLDLSRAQHFTEEYIAQPDGHWGAGIIEFGAIDQIMYLVKRWNVSVPTPSGHVSPTCLALWTPNEPHRYISFDDIEKQAKLGADNDI
jgi:hypothetical protein